MDDLKKGILCRFLELVQKDYTLDLELRDGYINLYYRGGRMIEIKDKNQYYSISFDKKFIVNNNGFDFEKLPNKITTINDANAWERAIPSIKYNIDLHFFEDPMEEREKTQLIIRENNYGKAEETLSICEFKNEECGVNIEIEKYSMKDQAKNMPSRTTDYYICDTECNTDFGELDLVGVKWLSDPIEKKNNRELKLVLFEVKYGDEVVGGKDGICSKIQKLNEKLTEENLKQLKEKMKCSFNQKIELGLINNEKFIVSFDSKKPDFVFIIANHNFRKKALRNQLDTLPKCDKADIKFAVAKFMGYGLYANCIFDVDEFKLKLDSLI